MQAESAAQIGRTLWRMHRYGACRFENVKAFNSLPPIGEWLERTHHHYPNFTDCPVQTSHHHSQSSTILIPTTQLITNSFSSWRPTIRNTSLSAPSSKHELNSRILVNTVRWKTDTTQSKPTCAPTAVRAIQTDSAPLEAPSVLLMSGGVESATLLYLWKDRSIWPL